MKIISGGQTGADQGALEAGKELGFETGGWAPFGWITEEGTAKELLQGYGLQMCPDYGFKARTRKNIEDADLTIIYGKLSSAGSKYTEHVCQAKKKPYAVNPMPMMIKKLIEKYDVKVLNVAGNRESVTPGIKEHVRRTLIEGFRSY